MKKLFAVLAVSAFLFACNSGSESTESTSTDSTTQTVAPTTDSTVAPTTDSTAAPVSADSTKTDSTAK